MSALLLIHAFPVDATMWNDQVAVLGGETDVLAPSLPGFGGAAPVGDILTIEAMADYLVEELDRAGVDRAVVCGLSMGGYAAFGMWRRHRARIAGLVLADTRAEADDEAGVDRRRQLAQNVLSQGSVWLADNPPPLLSENTSPMLWDRVKDTIRSQPPEALAAASLGMAQRPNSRPILGEIDVPTAVIVGSADTLTPPPMSEAMASAIPDAELSVLEGAGHLSNLEDPEGFVEAVRGLLRRVG
jgi:pimeloyl-ACP methyl ester carboxylesterase